MKFVSAQPDSDYYIWQLQVQMNNFKKFGIEKDAIILLAYNPKKGINPAAREFKKSTKAKVIFYDDDRNPDEHAYVPSIQPRMLKHFAVRFDHEIRTERIFYHDADMLFKKLPDFDSMNNDVTYLSDTTSYIGADYIKSKGLPTFKKMCSIVGLKPKLVESNQSVSGGAQHCFHPNDKMGWEFWEKVEKDSIKLFEYTRSTEIPYLKTTTTNKDPKIKDYPIQSWTSGMWSLLWNLWLVGIKTEISPELSFSWATDKIEELNKHNIFHNAGVNVNDEHLFLKSNYMTILPFNQALNPNENYCSGFYVKEILETAKTVDLSIYDKKR